MNNKRLEQLKEAWINNVVKVQGVKKEDAEKMFDKIQPFKNEPSGTSTKNENDRQ